MAAVLDVMPGCPKMSQNVPPEKDPTPCPGRHPHTAAPAGLEGVLQNATHCNTKKDPWRTRNLKIGFG
jgi:hypothetical protein